MKKILCFILSFMLLFNTTVVYADISGTLPTPLPTIPPLPPDPAEFLIRLCLPDGGEATDYVSDWLKKRWSNDEDKSKDMSSDGNTVTFNSNFVNEFNTALQNKVHALDGYWLYDSYASLDDYISNSLSRLSYYHVEQGKIYVQQFKTNMQNFQTVFKGSSGSYFYHLSSDVYVYFKSNFHQIAFCDNSLKEKKVYVSYLNFTSSSCGLPNSYISYMANFNHPDINNEISIYAGSPLKIFYSLQDLQNYLNKGRTYVPQLPSGGFKVNIKYINNTTNLPDITYNITTENKTETEIQNQYDTTINNYLNGLDDFTDGGGTTNPTPTPSSGGSGGDLGDGTTPTPKPDFTDGSLTDTNTLLQKILDKLTEFSANHDKLAKTITDYLEKNDGKLEEILLAIQALSDGKTETEQNGCKYDFTALSEYLTKLWNNSDQKFDEMVKLLEENNKYQQKLVDSLNEIKALLIADTVMDFFKDRSQETAEKAKDKFPTSIPWDVSLVLNSMSAEPKNPKFSLPIKIESFKINETIDIDLSTDEWEKLAKTCRYILSVTFILFLIHLSRKLFSSGGDD